MGKKTAKGPKFVSYFWPVIEVLKMLGGSARPSEVREQLVRSLGISEEAQEDTLPSGFLALTIRLSKCWHYRFIRARRVGSHRERSVS